MQRIADFYHKRAAKCKEMIKLLDTQRQPVVFTFTFNNSTTLTFDIDSGDFDMCMSFFMYFQVHSRERVEESLRLLRALGEDYKPVASE